MLKDNTKKVGAVNEILKKVKGDLICFQDADDWSEPSRIFEQVSQFEKNENLGICFTNFRNVGKKTWIPEKVVTYQRRFEKGVPPVRKRTKLGNELTRMRDNDDQQSGFR